MRRPNLGVYLDRPSLDIDPRGLKDCLNVKIRDKRIVAEGMGWENFPQFASDVNRINLDDLRVLFIDEYRSTAGVTTAIFCNQKDIFKFNPSAGPPATVTYMTPRYAVGTASCAGSTTTIVGAGGALWDTGKTTAPIDGGYGNNVKAGNYISFGAADEDAQDATWYEIDSVTDDTHLELLVDPGVVADGPYTIRQTLTGDNNDIFEAATFQNSQDTRHLGLDVYYMTNGVEMFSWDGNDPTFLRFWPGFTGKNLRVTRQVLVIWNLLESGTRKHGSLRYSDTSHPDNMATEGAGEILPSDGILDLLNVVPLGDQLVCYYQGDLVMLQSVDAPLYYIARVAVPGVGLVAQRAMMDFGDYHEFLSVDGAYRFDGVTITEAMPQVFRDVLRRISPNRIKQAYAHIDEPNGEVIWSIPLATDGQADDAAPSIAYAEHYLEDVGPNLSTPMTIRAFPFTAFGIYLATGSLKFSDFPATYFEDSALQWDDRALQQAFPFEIVGDENGDIYIRNTSNTMAGGAVVSFAQFPRFALGDGEFKALLHHVEPYASRRQGASSYELRCVVKFFDFADTSKVSNTASATFDLTNESLRYMPIRGGGRFAEILFYTIGGQVPVQSEPWDCAGYAIKTSAMGDR